MKSNISAGSRGKEVDLTFLDKMEIAIGIANGIRYMHEECPRGPIAHGDLKPHNIILGHDLKPQVKIQEKKNPKKYPKKKKKTLFDSVVLTDLWLWASNLAAS